MLNFVFLMKNSQIKHLIFKIKKYKVIICRCDIYLCVEQVYLEHKKELINKISRIIAILIILLIKL